MVLVPGQVSYFKPPPEAIHHSLQMSYGDGSTVGNVQDGFNVRKAYKIIKDMRQVSALHGAIDI